MALKKIKESIKKLDEFANESARAQANLEVFKTQQHGTIEYKHNESYANLNQNVLKNSVDVQTQEQAFTLDLPYDFHRVAYDVTGRHMLLYTTGGAISQFDVKTKHLFFESELHDKVKTATFLHNELFHAVAQKNVFIYNSQGIEVHCIRRMKHINHFEYLTNHFLLAGASNTRLQYLDTSIGKLVAEIDTSQNITVMKQNKSNAVIALGDDKGTVTFWSPNENTCLMKSLCHNSEIKCLEITNDGPHMITTGNDNCIKVWDLRNNCRPINMIEIPTNFATSALSDMNMLALGSKNKICIFKNLTQDMGDYKQHIHLKDKLSGRIVQNMKFVPHEDILTVAHTLGVTNWIVPGSGDPNITQSTNPYRTKKQRQNEEVKMLLEKIPYQMISMKRFVEAVESEEVPVVEKTVERQKTALDRFYKK